MCELLCACLLECVCNDNTISVDNYITEDWRTQSWIVGQGNN